MPSDKSDGITTPRIIFLRPFEEETKLIKFVSIALQLSEFKASLPTLNNITAPGTRIAYDRNQVASGYHVSDSGFVVLPHGKEEFGSLY